MKKFTVTDWTGLKSREVVETKDFFVISEDNVAIRREDFIGNDSYDFIFENKYPLYYAINRVTYELYTYRGEYNLTRTDTLKAILNGRTNYIVHDKFKEDRFFYDVKMFPMMRPFQVELSSLEWEIFDLYHKLQNTKNVTKLEITSFSPMETVQKLKFMYVPKTKEEFENIIINARDEYYIIPYIIDRLNIEQFYKKDEN